MLGVGSRDEKGRAIKEKYSDLKNVDSAFSDLKKYWQKKISMLPVQDAESRT